MKCPVDNENLVMSDRNGVEIDYCPACRGVWLDRGELDKIIERSSQFDQKRSYDDNNDKTRFSNSGGDQGYRKKKKESFLGDLFDF